MMMVEVIPGDATSGRDVETTMELARKLRKSGGGNDAPGFVSKL